MLRKLLLHVEVAFYFSLKMHLNSSFSSFLSSRAVAGIKGVGMIKNGFNAHVIMWKKEDLKRAPQHHHKNWLLSFSYWIPWWLGDSGSQYRVILELLTFGYDLQKKRKWKLLLLHFQEEGNKTDFSRSISTMAPSFQFRYFTPNSISHWGRIIFSSKYWLFTIGEKLPQCVKSTHPLHFQIPIFSNAFLRDGEFHSISHTERSSRSFSAFLIVG